MALASRSGLDVGHHQPQHAQVHRAGNEMVFDLRDAHKGRNIRGLEPGGEIGQIGIGEGRMLGVKDDKIRTGIGQHLRHPTRAKFENHMADRNIARGQNLLKTIGFHVGLPHVNFADKLTTDDRQMTHPVGARQ